MEVMISRFDIMFSSALETISVPCHILVQTTLVKATMKYQSFRVLKS